jgi:hypothetical protein
MKIDPKRLDDTQLQNLIENHRRKGATELATYKEALIEQATRIGKGLDFETTIKVISQAAREGRYISYGDVAKASGVDWNQVRYAMGRHLDDLIEYCHLNDLPLLSSIVVNKPNVESGKLDPESLKGFIAGVRRLNIPVLDDRAFLHEAQKRVFEWARR